jgi:hypothetical protein
MPRGGVVLASPDPSAGGLVIEFSCQTCRASFTPTREDVLRGHRRTARTACGSCAPDAFLK